MKRILALVSVAALSLATAAVVPAALRPHVSISSLEKLRQPLPLPHAEKADADR
jgi:hypothetical protein